MGGKSTSGKTLYIPITIEIDKFREEKNRWVTTNACLITSNNKLHQMFVIMEEKRIILMKK